MLAWGKNLLNVKSCVTPTGPDHSKNRETVYLDHCHQTGPEAGGTEMTIKCPKCGTQLPVGSGLNLFGNLGHLLPYTYTRTIQEMPETSHPRSGIPVQGPAFRFVHSTLGVHRDPKGGEIDGHTQGFKKPPVPRRLVGESQIPPGLSPTYTGTSK